MYRIVYKSIETAPFNHTKLKKLLVQSRLRNAEHDVSGMLIYDHGAFLQLLEGEIGAVKDILVRIERDPRHKHLTVLLTDENIPERAFGKWSMGYADGRDAMSILRGFINLPHGLSTPDLDRTSAVEILVEAARQAA
jgi:hypothetical protein